MALLPMVGHEAVRREILAAIDAGTLPQTILVVGPPGVGKQRFALWVAQRVVCTGPPGEPCGACASCRKVSNLAHPDVHWVVPIQRPKAPDPARQVEEAEEALAEVMAERRERPLWTAPDGMAVHGVASARLLLRKSALTPVEAAKKVFVVGHAERLIPQEANPEAANALLKVLEEPPADTVFLLTTSEPRRLLPTIRSRAVMLRLRRLPDGQVREFFRAHLADSANADRLEERVSWAEGAIGAGLADEGTVAGQRESAAALVAAVQAGDGSALRVALAQNPWQARGGFSDLLDAVGELLSDLARVRAGHRPRRPVPEKLAPGPDLEALGRAVERVQAARELAQGNVNPQLLLAELSRELEELLCR